MRAPAIDYASLDRRSAVPMAEQIRLAVRRAIAERKVKVGDHLPTVREVARRAGVNMNTVARAYRRLGEEGLVDGGRGRGTQVLAYRQRRPIQRTDLREKVRDLVADAVLGGLSKKTVHSILKRMEGPWTRPGKSGS